MLAAAFGLLAASMLSAAPLARLEVTIEQPAQPGQIPLEIDLDALDPAAPGDVLLHEVRDGRRVTVPAQVSTGPRRTLHWLVETGEGAAARRTFEVSAGQPSGLEPGLSLHRQDGLLSVRAAEQDLLGYQFGRMDVPQGVDPVFGRSGFIHPLRTPRGHVLTRVQPPDHYHHYGLWNPWTQVEFRGATVDFWNLAKREGTVRFAQFAALGAGPVFGEFRAVHEHVVLKPDPAGEVVMTELQSVRVYRPAGDQAYFVDLVIEMSPTTTDPVRLLEYRYGGLGWRATEEWHKGNSSVLTSEGLTRAQADGSTARWCLIQGELGGDRGGIVLMSHPSNYNHPEPLRIWPENSEGRGDVFANFSPTKNRDWLLEPGRTYLLRYRLLVFDGQLDAAAAEQAWRDFARPPAITVVR